VLKLDYDKDAPEFSKIKELVVKLGYVALEKKKF
jgi:hypothetical protein